MLNNFLLFVPLGATLGLAVAKVSGALSWPWLAVLFAPGLAVLAFFLLCIFAAESVM